MTVLTEPILSAAEPGGLAEYKCRDFDEGPLAGCAIEFESAPPGYLTKKGEPRKTPWRAYWFTDRDGARKRQTSVTTLLTPIMDKPGLPPWAEARGIEGLQEAHRRGLVDADTDHATAVAVVRSERLGADAARDEAARRGLNVHALLEDFARTGTPPRAADHPPEHRGYIRALISWLLHTQPEPIQIEELVCDPHAGYAGRMDLLANIGGFLTAVDFKTSERASIWESAHVQLAMYIRAHVVSGGEEPTTGRIVVMAADGGFAEMEMAATSDTVECALAFSRALAPIRNVCAAHNRAEKKARAVA